MAAKKKNRLSLKNVVTKRSVGLLPTLITTASTFCAFYALVATWEGRYTFAAIAIIVASFLDALDGRVARMVKSSSSFGEHYDSLADVIAFGVAPAFLVYAWGIHSYGSGGIALCFIYMVCCCLRLARFATHNEGIHLFRGMPSTVGGSYVASLIWLSDFYEFPMIPETLAVAICMLVSGLLMISSLPFISGRSFRLLSHSHSTFHIALIVFYTGVLIVHPPLTLFVSGSLYILFSSLSGLKKHFFFKTRSPSSHGTHPKPRKP